MFRQARPAFDKLHQVRVFLQQNGQAGVKDRIFGFCKCLISNNLLIFVKGFESPWGYLIKFKVQESECDTNRQLEH
jgi:hypothetical protein